MILILGGTTQGRSAVQMADQSGNIFYYSTLGSLQEVISHNGVRITGGMDSLQMEQFCLTNEIELLVDAAHPFAEQLHKTVYEVSCKLHLPVVRYEREFPQRSDDIIWCDNYQQAIVKMRKNGVHRLLALTGVNTISQLKPFWENEPQSYFRVLDRSESIGIAQKNGFPIENLIFFNHNFLPYTTERTAVDSDGTKATVLSMQEYERQVLATIHPDAMITKESGASGFFNEKTEVARMAGVAIYAVKRPELPECFINVYGPIGLRKQIESLVPGFFPLRIGYTTGTCATAATKGALLYALYGKTFNSVFVTLPSMERVQLPVRLKSDVVTVHNSTTCSVIKDSGDDPDITNASEIISTVEIIISSEQEILDVAPEQVTLDKISSYFKNETLVPITFLQGEGVGRVTLPGLGLEIGGPAINSTPRKMIENEIGNILAEYSSCSGSGLPSCFSIARINVTISVPGGRELAAKTFNPKLGIVDGISIIGTSGVVKPFSQEAFLNSIKKEIEVAIAVGGKTLVINSGAKSERAIQEYVRDLRREEGKQPLLAQSFIHYGNFIGDTISIASSLGVTEIIMGIMLGKAVKLAEGNLDTHSKIVTMNKEFLKQVAKDAGCSAAVGFTTPCIIDNLTLARELWDALSAHDASKFFSYITQLCHKHCDGLLPGGEIKIILIR